MIVIPQCFFCQRFHRDEEGRKCDAYPDGIPPEVFKSEVDHTKPYKGDNGLTFLDVLDEEPSDKQDRVPFEEVRYTGDEDVDAVLFAESMVNKALARSRAKDIIEALLRVTVPDSFQALSPSQARLAMEKLVAAMTQAGGWSVSGVVDELKRSFPSVDDFQLRRIVRTESSRIATRAHEIEAVENDPPTARYAWRGPRDWRTCKIHQAIVDSQPAEGLPLDELKVHVAQVAAEFGTKVQDDWIVHPNQRGSFTRVFVKN